MRYQSLWLIVFLFWAERMQAQEPVLKAGDFFPDLLLTNISNAPVKTLQLSRANDRELYLLNFWGTWCGSCIPEMDTLARLQQANAAIRVIAISDDSPERKKRYLAKKPSVLWLATDTSYLLYRMLGLASVGHCVVVNRYHRIVAVLKTSTVNQQVINRLLQGQAVASDAAIREALLQTKEDAFGTDSLVSQSFTIRGYLQGHRTMGKHYPDAPFEGRRLSWFNVPIETLYREAYGIYSQNQEYYDSSVMKKEVADYENKQSWYCVDLLVGPAQKDSLYLMLQQKLNSNLPVKVRQEYRMLPVYLLKQKKGAPLNLAVSRAAKTTYSFSGKGYEGEKIRLADFATHYLTNELSLPVLDETGLTGAYDIRTQVDLRTVENIRASVAGLGLEVVKAERRMPVIVYYK